MDKLSSEESVIFTVDAKGRAPFATVQAAIDFADQFHERLVKIYILAGCYHEKVRLYQNHIQLIGVGDVEITNDLFASQKASDGTELGTFRTSTLFINGQDMLLKNLTISNSAGTHGHEVGQAIAVYCEGTNINFMNCRLRGHQDTLCLGPLPSLQKNGTAFVTEDMQDDFSVQKYGFYDCTIEGTVDFIFGGGQATFSNCQLIALPRENLGEVDYLTAASSNELSAGFTFSYCAVKAIGNQTYYLGRPWRSQAKTNFNRCLFDKNLHADGWNDWQRSADQQTVSYTEHNCYYETKEIHRADWIDFNRMEGK
ncbi:pectinesterase family protein [Lapidilactobacillus mulanensis]|uniref:Pectinesterase n=1 Tax=Lapidilactobacillus mulanensis TaxID=2485999 RepID=A0ABW4DST5_9LACO|nr:pectinesterase family protein [Lapidilactobacillus mulanensis]